MKITFKRIYNKIIKKFPQNPIDFLNIIFKLFLFGLIPLSLIILIDLARIFVFKPFVVINKIFSTYSWFYLLWWITIVIEPAAGFFGIWIAFEMERRNEKSKFNQRVDEIVPYIYFELIENQIILRDTKVEPDEYEQKIIRFNTSNWSLFKNVISEWREINVVPLTRLYYYLDKVNMLYDNIWEKTGSPARNKKSEAKRCINNAIHIINEQMEVYDNWIIDKKKSSVIKNMKGLLKNYEKISNEDESLIKIIETVKSKIFMQ